MDLRLQTQEQPEQDSILHFEQFHLIVGGSLSPMELSVERAPNLYLTFLGFSSSLDAAQWTWTRRSLSGWSQ